MPQVADFGSMGIGSLSLPSRPGMRLTIRSGTTSDNQLGPSQGNSPRHGSRLPPSISPRSGSRVPNSPRSVADQSTYEFPSKLDAYHRSGSKHGLGSELSRSERVDQRSFKAADALSSFSLDINLAGSGPSAEAMAAARSHLAEVLQQVNWLQERIEAEKDSLIGAADRDKRTIEELRRTIKHLEVDLEHSRQRSEQLSTEKQELMQVQGRLEGELRGARDALEACKQECRHRSTDVQQLTRQLINAELTPVVAFSPRLEYMSPAMVDSQQGPLEDEALERRDAEEVEFSVESPSRASRHQLTGGDDSLRNPILQAVTEMPVTKASLPSSKAQAVAVVQAAQAEALRERRKREKLERQLHKDHSRLLQLVAVAQQQREEIRLLEGQMAEAGVPLQTGMTSSTAAGGVGAAASSASTDMAVASPLGQTAKGGGPGMQRHQSAPTRLPPVS